MTSPPVQIEDSTPQSWHSMPRDSNVASGRGSPLHLKNSIAAAALSDVEKVDPLDRAQSDANESGDGLRPPKLPHEKREASFSTE
jgi:hypothetical protein